MKRAMDVTISAVALLTLSPIMGAIALIIRATMGGPVLFRQKRPGLNGQIFEIIKFRTMRDAYSSNGVPIPDDQRLTRFGKILRSTSLDELPELINVLRGEMSLIGPRPLLEDYLALYDKRQARRHDVLPGLTGWAQINGRNAITWDQKFELDVWYVDNRSARLDFQILFQTVLSVVKRDDISAEGTHTAHRFKGAATETLIDLRGHQTTSTNTEATLT